MNIQPSVIIWTIICFFVLMLVLDRLLFRPMFAFMRARRKKIDDAAAEIAMRKQQLADEAEGAGPATDHAAKQHTIKHQNACNIVEGAAVGRAECALQRTQGTGGHGAGAGVAVDAGGAEYLGVALVDLARGEVLHLGVKQQREIQLHQLALGGPNLFDPILHTLTPIPRTQCRC